jgi:hypothetical protein
MYLCFLKLVKNNLTLTQALLEIKTGFVVFFFNIFYFSFVAKPHGVFGNFIDLVLPPCGWSNAFIATPLTFGPNPKFLLYLLQSNKSFFLVFKNNVELLQYA